MNSFHSRFVALGMLAGAVFGVSGAGAFERATYEQDLQRLDAAVGSACGEKIISETKFELAHQTADLSQKRVTELQSEIKRLLRIVDDPRGSVTRELAGEFDRRIDEAKRSVMEEEGTMEALSTMEAYGKRARPMRRDRARDRVRVARARLSEIRGKRQGFLASAASPDGTVGRLAVQRGNSATNELAQVTGLVVKFERLSSRALACACDSGAAHGRFGECRRALTSPGHDGVTDPAEQAIYDQALRDELAREAEDKAAEKAADANGGAGSAR